MRGESLTHHLCVLVSTIMLITALGAYVARRSLHSDDGLLNIKVGLQPKQVKLGTSALTLGLTLTPKGIGFVAQEF